MIGQELGKDVELLREELVREVDGGVEDAQAVLAHRGGDGLDLDGVQVLGCVARPTFHEQLASAYNKGGGEGGTSGEP